MRILRRKTRVIKIGDVSIGGRNPVAIQSMAKSKTSDTEKTIAQIKELENAGCEIARLAIKDSADAKALKTIKSKTNIPIVADIHFNWRLALAAIDNGVDKIRLNPGNIYRREEIRQIAKAAKSNRIPIRVGINSGSLRSHRESSSTFQRSVRDRMVKSALDYIKILESFGFYDIVVSLKASNIFDTVEAYRKMAMVCDCPFHLGVTATGFALGGAIKSSIAVGALLLQGIGDTLRISLTDKSSNEIEVAKSILEALDLRHFGPQIISCPTCGRCEVDLLKIVRELEKKLLTIDYGLWTLPVKLAVMGCVVNGPGEARQADIGVAFGKKEGLLFRKGKPVRKVTFENCINDLLKEITAKPADRQT